MTGPITVAMLNRKGGCGKTSTCHHLAGAYAKEGRRVLLVEHGPASLVDSRAVRPAGDRGLARAVEPSPACSTTPSTPTPRN